MAGPDGLPQPTATGEPTAPYDGAPATPPDRPRVALIAGSEPPASAELRDLLQRRGRVVCVLGLFASVSITAILLPFWLRDNNWEMIVRHGVLCVLAAAATVFLRRRRSLQTLRTLELLTVGALVAVLVWHTFFALVQMRFAAGFAKIGEAHLYIRLHPFGSGPNEPVEERHFNLQDWTMWALAAFENLFWFALIVSYGVFVPNTWRRCTAVVGAVTLTAVGLHGLVCLADSDVSPLMAGVLMLSTVFWLTLASAIAVFGSHRIERLRREALTARRLGQYRLKELIGAGGMGEVYLAEHVLLRRPCAVKLIRPERAGDQKNLLRFEREVRATATLTGWHTVEIYDYGHAADGTFYYAMEYLPGPNLEQLVGRGGPLPPARAVHLLRQVCRALSEAHAIGLIHRDVKPSNVIACRRGGMDDVAKLLDFGLVQAQGLGEGSNRLTLEGSVAGTPAYMSPEQAGGADGLDARSDIYSLGAVAYFLLTGRPPFVRKTGVQVLAAHLHEPPPPPRALRADVPPDLEAVVLRCLEKDPAKRFPDADSLERALAGCACAAG
jgi:tRNA A-37 threonylcarbamoyl transferase component Bud32